MLRTLLATAVAMSLALAASGSDWPKGENLITPFVPSVDEWGAYAKPSDQSTTLWKLKANESDQYAVSVHRKYKKDLSAFRSLQDEPGHKYCTTFESTVIEDQPVNGYSRLIWRTLCIRDDSSKTSMLHIAVQGRDSFYHLQKIWRFDVSDTDVGTWSSRFKVIFVCDTRNKNQPCPEGFKRVE